MAEGQDHVSKACKEGLALLERLVGCSRPGDADDRYLLHCPHWLPRAKAVVFCKSVKMGALVGVQHGHAFAVSRLPYGSAGGRQWSAPCFLKLEGAEWGLVLGAARVESLIGMMSERGLARLASGAKLALGAEAAVAVPGADVSPSAELFLTNLTDWTSVSVSRGFMLDVAVQGMALTVDTLKNEESYGEGVSAADVLHGAVPLPPAAAPLAHRLREMEDYAVAAAFEPSHAASEGESGQD